VYAPGVEATVAADVSAEDEETVVT